MMCGSGKEVPSDRNTCMTGRNPCMMCGSGKEVPSDRNTCMTGRSCVMSCAHSAPHNDSQVPAAAHPALLGDCRPDVNVSDRTVHPPLFRDRISKCTNLFRLEPNRTFRLAYNASWTAGAIITCSYKTQACRSIY